MKQHITPIIIALSVLAVLLRILPHPANVAPIGALALFTGIYGRKRSAFLLPLAAMVVSDTFIGFYDLRIMIVVYGSFVVTALIGVLLRKCKNPAGIVVGSLAGATFFYLTTNFAVWAFTPLYPHTAGGLLLSYAMGLPFFRNTLVGDLLYTGLFVGGYECVILLSSLIRKRRRVAGAFGVIARRC